MEDNFVANKALTWVKRTSCVTLYTYLTTFLCVVGIADSTFWADDVDCLALPAAITRVAEPRSGMECQVGRLQYWTSSEGNIPVSVESIYGAELNNGLEVADLLILLDGFMQKVVHFATDSSALRK